MSEPRLPMVVVVAGSFLVYMAALGDFEPLLTGAMCFVGTVLCFVAGRLTYRGRER